MNWKPILQDIAPLALIAKQAGLSPKEFYLAQFFAFAEKNPGKFPLLCSILHGPCKTLKEAIEMIESGYFAWLPVEI